MVPGVHFAKYTGILDPNIPYRELNGALLWPARKTHPEIMFAVVYLSRFNNAYTKVHQDAQLRILGYLMNVRDRALTFHKPTTGDSLPPMVVVYSDSDFAEDVMDRKSYSGSVTFVDGNLVAWSAGKQRYVATSSTEAEYVAVSESCKDGLHVIHFLNEFLNPVLPSILKMDNQGALFMAKNDVSSKRSKHVDLRYHMVRDYVRSGYFTLTHVSTVLNRADIMTKALDRLKHEGHTSALLRDYSNKS